MELGGLEGLGAYIKLTFQYSLLLLLLLSFFLGLCCFFPFFPIFSISTFEFIFAVYFISKFLYFMYPMPLLDIVHGNYKCS